MMTNYNERLDEILTEYATRYFQLLRTNAPRELEEAKRIEAKQAITSLIKELVGEREYSIEIYLHDRNGTVKMKKETVKVMSPRNIFSIPIDNYRRVKVVVQELTKEEGNQ